VLAPNFIHEENEMREIRLGREKCRLREELKALRAQEADLKQKYERELQTYGNAIGTRTNRPERRAAFLALNSVAKQYFNCCDQTVAVERRPGKNTKHNLSVAHSSDDVAGILVTISSHYRLVFRDAGAAGVERETIRPTITDYVNLKTCLAQTNPELARKLRDAFIQADLPTYRFENEVSNLASESHRQMAFFLVGAILLVLAIGLAIWGFKNGDLTNDQRAILLWALPLASGFAACSFSGALQVRGDRIVRGALVTATGGFAVWLLT
jgi:hypothetical protein